MNTNSVYGPLVMISGAQHARQMNLGGGVLYVEE